MGEAQISISWNMYRNHVSKGFSQLQQNAEFVDMTLAADGHLVKVHQNIVALSSPYLKAMLQSASCQHPVIFLYNVSNKILGYILEYIYTGEVQIPTDETDKFIEACKSLCIRGVDSINFSKDIPKMQTKSSFERIEKPPENNFAAVITINNQNNNYNLELLPNENKTMPGNTVEMSASAPPLLLPSTVPTANVGEMNYEDFESAIDNNVDVNGIRHFVILKPNNDSNNDEINNPNVINADKTIKLLSAETITPIDIASKTDSLFSEFDNTARNPSEITLDAKSLQRDPTKDSLNNIPSTHPVTITLNTKDLLSNSIQENSNVMPIVNPINIVLNTDDSSDAELNSNLQTLNTTDSIPIVLNNKKVYLRGLSKNIKNLRTHIRLNKSQEDKTALLKMYRSDITKMDSKTYFTVSNRGSIQMILNRFLYHSHHHSDCGRKRRWRCIDYRKIHCPAYIDTDNDVVMATQENHCHPNHDNQIKRKIKENVIFTTMTTAMNTIGTFMKKDKK